MATRRSTTAAREACTAEEELDHIADAQTSAGSSPAPWPTPPAVPASAGSIPSLGSHLAAAPRIELVSATAALADSPGSDQDTKAALDLF